MNKLLPVLIILLIFGAGSLFFLNRQKTTLPTPIPQGGVCDSETMTCSDGTILKKQPPNCNFPPCPSNSTSSSVIPSGERVTISGEMICLPHKNSSGPQTLECAFGLKADDGNNYALTDPHWKYLTGVGNGKRVEITGMLTKKPDPKYDSEGVIVIDSLTEK